MIDILQLISPKYLFVNFPRPLSPAMLRLWLGVSLLLIIGSIGIRLWLHFRADLLPAWVKWWQRVASAFVTFGFFALIFLFFRTEQTPWFSARYWIVLWFLSFVAWVAYLGFLAYQKIPERASQEADDRRRRKYLP